MSPRTILRAVAALFVVAGLFLLRLAMSAPAAPVASERIRGALAEVEFRATPKLGEWCFVTLTSGPTAFALQEPLADDPILRSELASRLIPGVQVELYCPTEEEGAAGADERAAPRPIRSLSANGSLICDVQARRGQGQALLHFALFVASVLALCGGIRAYRLSSRFTESGRSA
jgi:hypothetical protein